MIVIVNRVNERKNIIVQLFYFFICEIVYFVVIGLIILEKDVRSLRNLLKKFFVFGFVILNVNKLKVNQ